MNFLSVNQLLIELDRADWTANCGCPAAAGAEPARVVGSWAEAMTAAADPAAEDDLLEQANHIGLDVRARDVAAYNRWNEFVIDVKPEIQELVRQKLSRQSAGVSIAQGIIDTIDWVVIHAAIEVYYRAYSDRGFYRRFAAWLIRGHLPLAWEGEYPAGRAVVF